MSNTNLSSLAGQKQAKGRIWAIGCAISLPMLALDHVLYEAADYISLVQCRFSSAYHSARHILGAYHTFIKLSYAWTRCIKYCISKKIIIINKYCISISETKWDAGIVFHFVIAITVIIFSDIIDIMQMTKI